MTSQTIPFSAAYKKARVLLVLIILVLLGASIAAGIVFTNAFPALWPVGLLLILGLGTVSVVVANRKFIAAWFETSKRFQREYAEKVARELSAKHEVEDLTADKILTAWQAERGVPAYSKGEKDYDAFRRNVDFTVTKNRQTLQVRLVLHDEEWLLVEKEEIPVQDMKFEHNGKLYSPLPGAE